MSIRNRGPVILVLICHGNIYVSLTIDGQFCSFSLWCFPVKSHNVFVSEFCWALTPTLEQGTFLFNRMKSNVVWTVAIFLISRRYLYG